MKNIEEYKLEIANKHGYEQWHLLHLAVGSRIYWYYDKLLDEILNDELQTANHTILQLTAEKQALLDRINKHNEGLKFSEEI